MTAFINSKYHACMCGCGRKFLTEGCGWRRKFFDLIECKERHRQTIKLVKQNLRPPLDSSGKILCLNCLNSLPHSRKKRFCSANCREKFHAKQNLSKLEAVNA